MKTSYVISGTILEPHSDQWQILKFHQILKCDVFCKPKIKKLLKFTKNANDRSGKFYQIKRNKATLKFKQIFLLSSIMAFLIWFHSSFNERVSDLTNAFYLKQWKKSEPMQLVKLKENQKCKINKVNGFSVKWNANTAISRNRLPKWLI